MLIGLWAVKFNREPGLHVFSMAAGHLLISTRCSGVPPSYCTYTRQRLRLHAHLPQWPQ